MKSDKSDNKLEMEKELKDIFKTIDNEVESRFKDDATCRAMLLQKVRLECEAMFIDISMGKYKDKKFDFKKLKSMLVNRVSELAGEVEQERRATKLFRSNYIG